MNWGHASSPTLFGDTLILLCDHQPASYLLALDARTGKERWKVDRGKDRTSYSTPVVIEAPSGPELIVNSSERVDVYDPRTGAPLWHVGGANRFPIPVPVLPRRHHLHEPRLPEQPVHGRASGGRGDVSASHVVWQVETGAPYVSSLVPLRRAALHGDRRRHRDRGRCGDREEDLAGARRRRVHRIAGRGRRQGVFVQRERRDDRAEGRRHAGDSRPQSASASGSSHHRRLPTAIS